MDLQRIDQVVHQHPGTQKLADRNCSLEFGCMLRLNRKKLYASLQIFAQKHAGWVITVVNLLHLVNYLDIDVK